MTVVTICPLCQHNNKYGSTHCARCRNDFDTPIETVREQLHARVRHANRRFAMMLVLDVVLLLSLTLVPNFAVLAAWTAAFALAGWFTLVAARQRATWRYSMTVLAQKHGDLPKATVVSQ